MYGNFRVHLKSTVQSQQQFFILSFLSSRYNRVSIWSKPEAKCALRFHKYFVLYKIGYNFTFENIITFTVLASMQQCGELVVRWTHKMYHSPLPFEHSLQRKRWLPSVNTFFFVQCTRKVYFSVMTMKGILAWRKMSLYVCMCMICELIHNLHV